MLKDINFAKHEVLDKFHKKHEELVDTEVPEQES
jgi:hypothetical protein